jgi:hypothetical protein
LAKLLPYEKYTIDSPLTTEELLLKLFDKTLSAQEFVSESDKRIFSFGMKGWSKPYWGYIRKDSFELERLITYRNFGNPKVVGSIKQTQYGTAIHIKMKPPDSTLILVGLFILACLYGLIRTVMQSIKDNEMLPEVVVACGMIVFAYLLLLVAFKAEAVKSKRILADLFEKGEQPVKTAANTGLPN